MDLVLLDRRNDVATLTLNRPGSANSLDMPLASQLRDRATEVAADDRVRCVVLTGKGRMFCGGGDVGSFEQAADRKSYVTELASTLHQAILTLVAMPKPLLVQVNGPAAGAGLSLALVGDVVLAARSAHFLAAYTRIGMTPDGGMTWLLPRLIGFRRAQEMILTNRRVSADEAEQLGLITRGVDDDQLGQESASIAEQMAAASTTAIAVSRALLWKGLTASLADQLASEADSIGEAADTVDGREGAQAFLARHAPDFGRNR